MIANRKDKQSETYRLSTGRDAKIEVTEKQSGEENSCNRPERKAADTNIADQVATINKFSALNALESGSRGGWFVLVGVIHALGKFMECYVWKLGCLDGIAGLVIAMNSAWYVFLRHAKAWELRLREKNSIRH